MMSIIFFSVQPLSFGSESTFSIPFFLSFSLQHSADPYFSPSATLSGNGPHPTKNSLEIDDNMHVMIYRADRIQEELGLTRGGCILVGLMSGGDYHSVCRLLYPCPYSYNCLWPST